MGPTGSGKTSMANEVIEKENKNCISITDPNKIDNDMDCYKLLIDDMIENNNYYKNKVDDIIKTNLKCEGICDDKKIERFMGDEEALKKFEDSYFDTKNNGCNTNCSVKLDTILKESLESNKNIIIETTGTYFPQWLFGFIKDSGNKYKDSGNKYRIIFALTEVKLDTLLDRLHYRELGSIKKYLEDKKNNPAPRIIDKKKLENNIKLINKTKQIIIDITKHNFKNIPEINEKELLPFEFLIYDNNGSKIKLKEEYSYKP